MSLISGFLADQGGRASIAILALLFLLVGVAGIATRRRASGVILVALAAYMVAGVSPSDLSSPSDTSPVAALRQIPATAPCSAQVSPICLILDSASLSRQALHGEVPNGTGTVALQREPRASRTVEPRRPQVPPRPAVNEEE